MTAGMVRHRIPSYGFVVKEHAKGGSLLDIECVKRKIPVEHFPELKVKDNVECWVYLTFEGE